VPEFVSFNLVGHIPLVSAISLGNALFFRGRNMKTLTASRNTTTSTFNNETHIGSLMNKFLPDEDRAEDQISAYREMNDDFDLSSVADFGFEDDEIVWYVH
jgi:hypothetical protein